MQLCRGAAGTQIECLNGLLWITEEGEGRDVLLQPGDGIPLERDGRTLVEALKPSLVRLIESMPMATGGSCWKRLGLAIAGCFTETGIGRCPVIDSRTWN